MVDDYTTRRQSRPAKVTAEKILELGFRGATGEEEVSVTSIEHVPAVHQKLLTEAAIREALEVADEQLPADKKTLHEDQHFNHYRLKRWHS